LNDKERIEFIRLYTNEILKAIELDHVNVQGYFASSLMDGFQWTSGKDQFPIFGEIGFEFEELLETVKFYFYCMKVTPKGTGFIA